MNLTLFDAFARYGAKPANRLSSLSAMAPDGAMVLNCLPAHFRHPTRGVLRYEATLSLVEAQTKDVGILGEHLTHARDGQLPVRMVVKSVTPVTSSGKGPGYHVRPDLLGRVVEFDGDHFIVDFTRPAPAPHAAARRK
ncbi:MAG TPA: hypothetical protein VHE11_14025 [Steroidobacteraceae bacterium]|nr:hypothetical protein [Steroidobacteraceae bacterium]